MLGQFIGSQKLPYKNVAVQLSKSCFGLTLIKSKRITPISTSRYEKHYSTTSVKYAIESELDSLVHSRNSNTIIKQSDVLPENIWRNYLKNNEIDKFTLHLLASLRGDDDFVKNLFKSGDLTYNELSIFINRIYKSNGHDIKRVIQNHHSLSYTELIYEIFELYTSTIPKESGIIKLNALHLKDLNLFITIFIKEAQLSKAQNVLQYIIDAEGSIEKITDHDTMVNFLRLRCGGLPKFWLVPQASYAVTKQTKKNSRLSSNSPNTRFPSSYKSTVPNTVLFEVINMILNKKVWKSKHSGILDSTIVYSLAHTFQKQMMDGFIKEHWGISSHGDPLDLFIKKKKVASAPSNEILIAIMSSYIYKDRNIDGAMKILDKFIRMYPDISLDNMFWRRLIQWCNRLWDPKIDRQGTFGYGCWNMMKNWNGAGTGKDVVLPYDFQIYEEFYRLFKRTNNGKIAAEIVSNVLIPHLSEKNVAVKKAELNLLNKYQTLAMNWLIERRQFKKAAFFIEEWSIDRNNRIQLREAFKKRKQLMLRKLSTRDKKSQSQKKRQDRYDEMEEEDMIIGRLW
ncbi:hypothetical protein Kpol_1068p3 [Vanderwaltozyma polyspora DSM 70294]|uniref:ATPase expression protein 2, mitochondrial n=1 Tax=Vanderwaltozyma polyspora (strain ATCC 22028 / DSM 70294 / BCRC 21397 / CBS 2163 / NBRC 10782 / NRRL Y-8283 / UCD 57-17) TaxID=436907 RepID=AEP2_VANPO|nr:uncharacterized protein Kpol_1068p3 [Vanderwaltozyma polyspora DSM 70294]A7TSQ8.1 RecName: Full=ATPase expression protein 2, mitochondrial; Flags: Precursor [Vanderwaltozyma polyspora DSM 70294]EDO14693.1 hypothetical protein Kpol_1068p3 [Vanderwaltozyma polyspora DSM 70294]